MILVVVVDGSRLLERVEPFMFRPVVEVQCTLPQVRQWSRLRMDVALSLGRLTGHLIKGTLVPFE